MNVGAEKVDNAEEEKDMGSIKVRPWGPLVSESVFSAAVGVGVGGYTWGAPTPPPGSPYSPVPVTQLELLAKNLANLAAPTGQQALSLQGVGAVNVGSLHHAQHTQHTLNLTGLHHLHHGKIIFFSPYIYIYKYIEIKFFFPLPFAIKKFPMRRFFFAGFTLIY